MFRKLLSLAVAIVIVVGCKKKTEDTSTEPNSLPTPTPGGRVELAAPTYSIKIREAQKGDKFKVVETKKNSAVFSFRERRNEN